MDKEQQKFWNALTLPVYKSCANCIRRGKECVSQQMTYDCAADHANAVWWRHWKWDGKEDKELGDILLVDENGFPFDDAY